MSVKSIFNILKRSRGNEEDINIYELNEIRRINSNTILLDVRSPQEYNEGYLNSSINIPLYELEMCCDCKLKDKEQVIVVYCQSGIRSKKAIKILKKNGFKNLYNLKGGLDSM